MKTARPGPRCGQGPRPGPPPTRDVLEPRFRAAELRQPARALACDQRPQPFMDQRCPLADPGQSVRLLQQGFVEIERRAHDSKSAKLICMKRASYDAWRQAAPADFAADRGASLPG